VKTGYCWGGLGGGSKFCVVDSKKWISEEYLNVKLTLQVLWPLEVAVQTLLPII